MVLLAGADRDVLNDLIHLIDEALTGSVTDDNLIEVKGSVDRFTMRLALGQILDYARYVSPAWKTVLVPSQPEPEILELFDASGVALIWPEGSSFADE